MLDEQLFRLLVDLADNSSDHHYSGLSKVAMTTLFLDSDSHPLYIKILLHFMLGGSVCLRLPEEE